MKWVELARFTDDVEAMVAWYQALLATAPTVRGSGMAIFTTDGVKLLIHKRYAPDEGELPPEDHTALSVPDLAAACQRLVQQGLVIEHPPEEYPWGRSAYLRDPDGRLIELCEGG